MFSNCMFEHRLNESSSIRFFFWMQFSFKGCRTTGAVIHFTPLCIQMPTLQLLAHDAGMFIQMRQHLNVWTSAFDTCTLRLLFAESRHHSSGWTEQPLSLTSLCRSLHLYLYLLRLFFITFLPFLLSSVAHCLPFLSSFLPLCHLPRLSFSVHTSLIIYTFPLLPSALLSPSIPCFASIPASLPSSLFPSPSCSPRLVLPSSLALHLPLLFSFPPLFLPLPIPLVPSPLFPLPPSRLCFFSSHHSLWLALNPTAQSFFLMCVCCLPLIQHRWVET